MLSDRSWDKIYKVVNFFPSLLIIIIMTGWVWAVMIFLLVFKGRKVMDKYQRDFINSPPLTYKQTIKWNIIAAIVLWVIVYSFFF